MRTLRLSSVLVFCVSFGSAVPACSSDSDDGVPAATGGTSVATGGRAASGGAAPATGGTSTSGSGGASSSQTAGAPTGGTVGAGGTSSQGGATDAGGTAAGGSSQGGTPTASGGDTAQGGGTSGGSGGSGGASPTAGAACATGGSGQDGGVAPVIAGGVRWVGRVDLTGASGQRFAWSGTGFVATVEGETISVRLKSEGGSEPVFFQPVIDGTPGARVSVATADGDKTVVLGSGLAAGDHRVELYRETEGKPEFAVSTFLGFESGTPKEPPPYCGRLIEVIGDSISAGYGNLGSEQHPDGGEDPSGGCGFSTETESAYLTYGAVAARELDADASIVAASGWGIYSDNGGNTSNVLPSVFERVFAGQPTPAWTFQAQPQAVVVNLGTNDFSANMSLDQAAFSGAYEAFLATVRSTYPEALILCAIGPMLYGTGLSNATAYINALVTKVNAAGDAKVKVLDFGQQNASNGTGCHWHPNAIENQRLAGILVTELRASLGW